MNKARIESVSKKFRQIMLSLKSLMPEALSIYLSHNGPHFNKKCCEFAISQMYKTDETQSISNSRKEEIFSLFIKEVETYYKKEKPHRPYAHRSVWGRYKFGIRRVLSGITTLVNKN